MQGGVSRGIFLKNGCVFSVFDEKYAKTSVPSVVQTSCFVQCFPIPCWSLSYWIRLHSRTEPEKKHLVRVRDIGCSDVLIGQSKFD